MSELTGAPVQEVEVEQKESDVQLVKKIIARVKADKQYFDKPFKRMQRDMIVAMHGREESWGEEKYSANVIGRHVKQKTSALYAKNPRVTAKRRETLDFAIWDESPESLQMALATMQQAQMIAAQAAATPPVADPMTGAVVQAAPEMPPGFVEAQALLADVQNGMERREQIKKIGKTAEILFTQAMREQKPVDFKTGAKQAVRRACTTGVGYVELAFQREYGPRPGLTEQLADARSRLDHLRRLSEEVQEGEIAEDDAEMAELERSVASLQAEEEIVLREGLIFDFPQSTKVIPDLMCRSLVGFIGARHLTIEYVFSTDQVEEMFEGVDLGKKFTGYNANGKEEDNPATQVVDEEGGRSKDANRGMVCVWKHYDKVSGLVYYVADGHPEFLRPPASPDVFVEDFWPVYALTFNAVESETELFPPSDATLLLNPQREYNRARQGKRDHRKAAQPRWAHRNGMLSPEDIEKLKAIQPFENIGLDLDPQVKLAEAIEVIPVPGVDPNLYDTGEIFSDIQLIGGTQESSYGGVAKATATESAIAANSTNSTDGSAIDDLDAWLTVIARAAGQILFREMSEEKVIEVVGPGAVWPHMTLAEIASEVFLEVEAGSTGKPNQAVEIQNWKELLPFLIQMPGLSPMWLARETLRRLDDKADLTEALTEGLPSIVMQNQNKQPGTGDPATDPAAQGGQGASNGPQPPGQAGTGPAFGSNQV